MKCEAVGDIVATNGIKRTKFNLMFSTNIYIYKIKKINLIACFADPYKCELILAMIPARANQLL